MQLGTRPSHFSACNIEKLGGVWDEATTLTCTHVVQLLVFYRRLMFKEVDLALFRALITSTAQMVMVSSYQLVT